MLKQRIKDFLRLKKARLWLGILACPLIVIGVFAIIPKNETKIYNFIKATRGDVFQEVSESGKIESGELLNLSFKSSEKVSEISVNVGQTIKAGDVLMKIDSSSLYSQLNEANAAVGTAKAQLDKLLAGATLQEISLAETGVENASQAYNASKANLSNVEKVSQETIDGYYDDGLVAIDEAYLKVYNSYATISNVYYSYFTLSDQTSITVKSSMDEVLSVSASLKSIADKAKLTQKEEDIDSGLQEARVALEKSFNSLDTVRKACDGSLYRDSVSSTDKTALETQRTSVATSLSSVANTQQLISYTKANNVYNISVAQSQLVTAEGALKEAEEQLKKMKTPAREEDVNLYRSQLNAALAKATTIQLQVNGTILASPVDGQVGTINKKVGEIVQPGESVITIVPSSPFSIKVNIYEEDIVKVDINDPVEITTNAFPDKVFSGKVILIEPAERVIDGVVYYQTTIGLEDAPSQMKSGMTADVTIKTDSRLDVLIVPDRVLKKMDGKTTVLVKSGRKVEERMIETGLKGSDYMIEVISGLNEGEEVVLSKKGE